MDVTIVIASEYDEAKGTCSHIESIKHFKCNVRTLIEGVGERV